MARGAYVMNLGQVPYTGSLGPPTLARRRRLAGCGPGHGPVARASTGGHARPAHRGGRAARAGRGRGRDRRHGPRRQVHVPRAGPARLLPDLRPDPPRAGREAVLPRPRGGADPHVACRRSRGDADRGLDGNLDRGRRSRGRSPPSASTSRSGSRRTGMRSTSTSTRRRSRSGSRPAASPTPRSRRSRPSSTGR